MVKFKPPSRYTNKPGVIRSGGSLITGLGKRALLIGGNRALQAVTPQLAVSLAGEGIAYTIRLFSGNCTQEEIRYYIQEAADEESDLIIGIGGGKALDLAKAVGNGLKLPVVTIPTVPTTCAAWSPISVLYDEFGRFTGYMALDQAPALVLADPEILIETPRRYLAAGIGALLAKWNTAEAKLYEKFDELDISIGVQSALLALGIIKDYGPIAFSHPETEEEEPKKIYRLVTDMLVLLAGMVGSLEKVPPRDSLMDVIETGLTKLPQTKERLHGERAAFALLVQLHFQQAGLEQIEKLTGLMIKFNLPVTLEELGLDIGDTGAYLIERIARSVVDSAMNGIEAVKIQGGHLHNFFADKGALLETVLQADQLGRKLHEELRGEAGVKLA